MKTKEYSFENFFSDNIEIQSDITIEKSLSSECFDGYSDEGIKDFYQSIEDLEFISSFEAVSRLNSEQKIKMLQKIKINYDINLINSIENYSNDYAQSVEGIIGKAFKFIIGIIERIINIIAKCISCVFGIISLMAKYIADLTSNPSEKKIKKFINNCKNIKIIHKSNESYDEPVNRETINRSSINSEDKIQSCATKIYNLLDKAVFNFSYKHDKYWETANQNEYAEAVAISVVMSENINHSLDKVIEIVEKYSHECIEYIQTMMTKLKTEQETNKKQFETNDVSLKGREMFLNLKTELSEIRNFKSVNYICNKENIENTLKYFAKDIQERYTFTMSNSVKNQIKKGTIALSDTKKRFEELEKILKSKAENDFYNKHGGKDTYETNELLSKHSTDETSKYNSGFGEMQRVIVLLSSLMVKISSTFNTRANCCKLIRNCIESLPED